MLVMAAFGLSARSTCATPVSPIALSPSLKRNGMQKNKNTADMHAMQSNVKNNDTHTHTHIVVLVRSMRWHTCSFTAALHAHAQHPRTQAHYSLPCCAPGTHMNSLRSSKLGMARASCLAPALPIPLLAKLFGTRARQRVCVCARETQKHGAKQTTC